MDWRSAAASWLDSWLHGWCSVLKQYGNRAEEEVKEEATASAESNGVGGACRANETPEPVVETEAAQRLTLGLTLDSEIALETAVVGDRVRAVLSRPIKEMGKVLAAAGSMALGNIVRLEKQGQPFDHYEVALEFHTLETSEGRLEYSATMTDAAPRLA